MPTRSIPLISGEIYHVFNRGIDKRPTFTDKREYKRALKAVSFYRFVSARPKLSRLLMLNEVERVEIITKLKSEEKLVDILCFCLMPNHFHFLIRQLVDKGIPSFISQFLNSYTRYFNTKHERVGPLFLDQFKAVRVESDEQLLHVSRYIHLNPYTSFILKGIEDLIIYKWSSFPEYIGVLKEGFCERDTILSFYKYRRKYQQFVFDQADYQRKLGKIKHLALED